MGDKTVIAFLGRQKEQVESNEITFCETFGWMTERKAPEQEPQFDICVYFKTVLPFDNGVCALDSVCSFILYFCCFLVLVAMPYN